MPPPPLVHPLATGPEQITHSRYFTWHYAAHCNVCQGLAILAQEGGGGGCLETTLELTCKLAERPPFAVPLSNYTFLSFGVYVCQRYCAAMRLLLMKR